MWGKHIGNWNPRLCGLYRSLSFGVYLIGGLVCGSIYFNQGWSCTSLPSICLCLCLLPLLHLRASCSICPLLSRSYWPLNMIRQTDRQTICPKEVWILLLGSDCSNETSVSLYSKVHELYATFSQLICSCCVTFLMWTPIHPSKTNWFYPSKNRSCLPVRVILTKDWHFSVQFHSFSRSRAPHLLQEELSLSPGTCYFSFTCAPRFSIIHPSLSKQISSGPMHQTQI